MPALLCTVLALDMEVQLAFEPHTGDDIFECGLILAELSLRRDSHEISERTVRHHDGHEPVRFPSAQRRIVGQLHRYGRTSVDPGSPTRRPRPRGRHLAHRVP